MSAATVRRLLIRCCAGTLAACGLVSTLSLAGLLAADACGTMVKWDMFLSFVEPLASTTPLMVLPGNHEYGSLL